MVAIAAVVVAGVDYTLVQEAAGPVNRPLNRRVNRLGLKVWERERGKQGGGTFLASRGNCHSGHGLSAVRLSSRATQHVLMVLPCSL